MASPYRSSSPTLSGAAQSVVHASTSTIVQDERELAIKFKAAHDEESLFDEASYSANTGPQDSDSPHPRKQQSTPLPFLLKPNADPNLVEWEGPNDPENPQNWSLWYKWWLTAVCTLMTLNVYVPRPRKLYFIITRVPSSSSLTHCLLARSPLQRRHLQCRSSRRNFMPPGK